MYPGAPATFISDVEDEELDDDCKRAIAEASSSPVSSPKSYIEGGHEELDDDCKRAILENQSLLDSDYEELDDDCKQAIEKERKRQEIADKIQLEEFKMKMRKQNMKRRHQFGMIMPVTTNFDQIKSTMNFRSIYSGFNLNKH